MENFSQNPSKLALVSTKNQERLGFAQKLWENVNIWGPLGHEIYTQNPYKLQIVGTGTKDQERWGFSQKTWIRGIRLFSFNPKVETKIPRNTKNEKRKKACSNNLNFGAKILF